MERQAIASSRPEIRTTDRYLLDRKRDVVRRARELQRRPVDARAAGRLLLAPGAGGGAQAARNKH